MRGRTNPKTLLPVKDGRLRTAGAQRSCAREVKNDRNRWPGVPIKPDFGLMGCRPGRGRSA